MNRRPKNARPKRWGRYPNRNYMGWLDSPTSLLWLLPPMAVATVVLYGLFGYWAACGLLGLYAALAVLVKPALRRWLGPERIVAWLAVPTGLREVQRNGQHRRHSWSSIRAVTESPEALIVETDDDELCFEGHPKVRARMARDVRDRLGRHAGEGQPIPPEQIAAWLGIGEDESLRLGRPRWMRMLIAMGFLYLPIQVLIVGSSPSPAWLVLLTLFGYLSFIYALARDDTTRVTAHGFEDQGIRLGWDEIDQVARVPTGWMVVADSREIILSGRSAGRVAAVVRQVLAARDAGAVLPRMTDIPDHALSRAGSA